MDISNNGSINFLDRVRLTYGIEKLKGLFNNLLENDFEKAVNLINDTSLHFCSLFVLRPQIKKLAHLCTRNKEVLGFIKSLQTKKARSAKGSLFDYEQMDYSNLKWIINTGYFDDGLNNEFDEILDVTAILLVKVYKDNSIPEILAEMIFNRHRKGRYFFDLAWAFFEANDPMNILIISNRLRLNNLKDVELARKLLSFIPCKDERIKNNRFMLYQYYYNWLQENYPFLYCTGESFQQTHNPIVYDVSLQAKYLCKSLSDKRNSTLRDLTEDKDILLEKFDKLGEDMQILLSNFSYLLYRKNIYWWNTWIHYPILEQIKIARTMIGGIS